MTVEEKKLLFSLKTRSIDVKANYKLKYKDLICRLCMKADAEESQSHLFSCDKITQEKSIKTEISNLTYENIYGNLTKQIEAIKIWKQIIRIWKMKLEAEILSPSGPQVHPLSGSGLSASYDYNLVKTSCNKNNCVNVTVQFSLELGL